MAVPSEPPLPQSKFPEKTERPETPPDKKTGKAGKPKKPPLREREPENGHERVEKIYLQNWDRLYAEGRVQTPDPVVNWGQTRKLLSTHFAKGITPDKIIGAVNGGLKNDFVMRGSYSLATMLSASVLNGLLNSTGPPSRHRIANDEVSGDWEKYFVRDDPDESFAKPPEAADG